MGANGLLHTRNGGKMFKKNYPGLAEWAEIWGWIEIGADENNSSLVRLIDEGGLVWETPESIKSLEQSLQAADKFISAWIAENS